MTTAAASQEAEAIAVVEDFLGALERLDIDRVLELSHPDITYFLAGTARGLAKGALSLVRSARS